MKGSQIGAQHKRPCNEDLPNVATDLFVAGTKVQDPWPPLTLGRVEVWDKGSGFSSVGFGAL